MKTLHPAGWIDHGTTPPQRVPARVEAAIAYVADALGHVVHTRWTLAMIRQHYASLADAKAAPPAIMRVLLDHEAAVEYWDRGRVRTVAAGEAPEPDVVLGPRAAYASPALQTGHRGRQARRDR